MERKSLWLWAGLGLVAVAIVILSGVSRRRHNDLAAMPNPMQPVIVEPIPPGAESQPAPAPAASAPSAVPIAVAEATAASATASSASLPAEGADRIRRIQTALRAAGYQTGPIDGKLGRLTQKAIRDFQEAQGLSVDGKVGPKTWARLEPYLAHASASTTSSASTSASNQ